MKRDAVRFPPSLAAAVILASITAVLPRATAQESAPVTIDASPTAAELLRRARDSATSNPAESARAVQEAVDRFAHKLVPQGDAGDRFQTAVAAAEQLLLQNAAVREAWLRGESAAAQRQLAQGEWTQVAELRALTPAGLQAMLMLAQQSMDEGRVSAARRWIDRALRHPALQPPQRDLLERARLDVAPPPSTPAASGSAASAGAGAAAAPWRPLWSHWLAESWLNRHFAEADPQLAAQAIRDAALNGTALLASARFAGDAILIADGTSVRCLDRLSGLERWKQIVGSLEDPAKSAPSDLTVAVPAGDLAITLPGRALLEQRSGLPRVAALALADGARQWDIHLDRLGRNDFEELFPHGEPQVIDDTVIVQARKSNARLESAAWVIALDRVSGALRWATSLGAAGGVRLAVSRPLSSPARSDADIIAATSLGAVARIDATNGQVVWLRRWGAPLREPRATNPAWQLPSPAVAGGRVFWIEPDQSTLVCMSAADGATQWQATLGVNEALPAARAVLADDQRVYLLGESVTAVDAADPSRVLWRLADASPAAGPVRGECALGRGLEGQPLLAVPLAERALLLEPASGRVVGELPLDGGGNLALEDGQLAVADAQRLSLAMQADEGERLLRRRLAAQPADPRCGLALLELGRAWGHGDLVLDGARAMAEAVRQGDAQRDAIADELLRRLLDAMGMKELDAAMRSQLVEIARNSARTPAQRAALALRLGDLAADEGQLEAAVTQWVALLDAPDLRDELVGEEPRSVSARAAALERIVSRPATAGFAARRRAFEKAQAEMRTSPAVSLVNRAHAAALLAPTGEDASHALHEAVRGARERGWSAEARACEAMAAAGGAGVRWPAAAAPTRWPSLGSARPRITALPGRLLPMSLEAECERPMSSILLAEPAAIALRGGDDLAIAWRVSFGDRDPMIMAMAPLLALWCPLSREDGALLALDPKDGASAWRIDSVLPLFQAERLASLGLVTANDRADAAAVACLRAGPVAALVRNDGEVVAVDLAKGAASWRLDSPIQAVDAMESSPSAIVIAGRESAVGDESAVVSSIQLVAAEDGAVLAQRAIPREWGRVRWVQILPDALLAATDEAVAMLELTPGLPVRWTQHDRRFKDSPTAQFAGPWCLLRDRAGNTAALSLATGRTASLPLSLPSSADADSSRMVVQPYRDQWLVRRPQRLSLHADDGALLGADAVASERRYDQVILGEDAVFAIDLVRPEMFGGPVDGPDFLLREFRPSDGLRSIGVPLSLRLNIGRLARTTAVNGWILLGGDDRTAAIPATPPH